MQARQFAVYILLSLTSLPASENGGSVLKASTAAGVFNIREHGATGDGATLDTAAINRAIEAAAAAGGGTVVFPAGKYLSFSIRLKSNVALHLGPGAVLVAATPATGFGEYDEPVPNEWGDVHRYQDYGHSHWRNSLIWGEGLDGVSITGPGLIDGEGLVRGANGPRAGRRGRGGRGGADYTAYGPNGTPPPGQAPTPAAGGEPEDPGPIIGNKAIALKNCRNVTLRDFSMLNGGHFALLATGVDNLTIDGLRVDTNRDGFDIDACRNVRISNCSVNAPMDDAIVLKSSYALGFARACENVTITNCQVSGYDVGSFLDGTFKRTVERAPDRDGPTGRIKFGTESNGGFKNITISNCVFDRSRGIALETVDGGVIEDIAISNIVMRDICNSPLFIRLGNRARGPEGTPVAKVRRISITNLVVSDADARYASLIAGLPGHPIEDLTLSDIRIQYRGGLSLDHVRQQPEELVNAFFQRNVPAGTTGPRDDPFAVPERENSYPEPSSFGILPAYGLYVRHARNVTVRNIDLGFVDDDSRPVVVLEDVSRVSFDAMKAERTEGAPMFVLREVRDFTARNVDGVPDARVEFEKDGTR